MNYTNIHIFLESFKPLKLDSIVLNKQIAFDTLSLMLFLSVFFVAQISQLQLSVALRSNKSKKKASEVSTI